MRSHMHITGYWSIRHTPRARKHNSTDIDDTYGNTHGKRRSSTHTDHIHAQIWRRRAPMAAHAHVLLSRRLQQPRRCPCSCRPTGRAPMSRPDGRLKDTPTGAGRAGPSGRMASTTTRLPSGCCIPGLVQLPLTAVRSAAKAAVNRPKSGVGCHSLTRLATHLKIFLPTN